MPSESPKHKRIRSFVRREGRITLGQMRALTDCWGEYGLELSSGPLDFENIFKRKSDVYFEIGFGMGQSLLAAAVKFPERDFIGVETYKAGIGSLLLAANNAGVSNLKVFNADAVEVLEKSIKDDSLSGMQIFFPDPWPKLRHHKRRLIQAEFINLCVKKLKANGLLHLATDWQNYAEHMLKVLGKFAILENIAGASCYAARSSMRPVVTRFENRGDKKGHEIYELAFLNKG